MNTTSLVVEMIIVGLQVAIWLAILLGSGWGFDAQVIDKLEKLVAPLTVIGVAVCYTIGLVVDALTAWLEDRLIPSHVDKAEKAARRVIMQRIRLTHRELYGDLDKDEYMLRLLRSTVFNILIFSLLCSALLLRTNGLEAWGYVAALIVFTVIAGYGWWRRRCNFVANRDAFYLVVRESQLNEPKSGDVAEIAQSAPEAGT